MSKREPGSRLVYSTDSGRPQGRPQGRPEGPTDGRRCPGCRRPLTECVCRDRSRSAGDGIVRLERQTKGRKGAGVTRVTGLPLPDAQIEALARSLKASCGVGGSVRDGVIELQGDQRDRLLGLLEAQGFRVKKAGG